MFHDGYGIPGFILSLISVIHGLFAVFTSLIVVTMLICHQYHNRLKREEKITLVLSINIYIVMIFYSATLTSINILTLLGDTLGMDFNSPWCIFRGYFVCMISCTMYQSFVIQALFRLCRIVYPSYRSFQLVSFYAICIPILMVISCVSVCPALILHDIVYIPNDSDCFIRFTNIRGILYVLFIAYGFPLFGLLFIYIRITSFIRKQTNNIAIAIQRRQKRDLLAIQRIFINVGLLAVTGIPGIVVIVLTLFTGIEYSVTYRIVWLGAEISVAILSIEMAFMTPQLKTIVFKRRYQNRVTTVEGSLQMGHVTTAD